MVYIPRIIEAPLLHHLKRGKSVLVLGPRQTGKSTLLARIPADLSLSFILPGVRLRYEKNPELLSNELQFLTQAKEKSLVILDEIQKLPLVLDIVQHFIDAGTIQFILTGSSARKLRRGSAVNLLPGRVVTMRLDPFVFDECKEDDIFKLLTYGSLPGIYNERNLEDREIDLQSYVETYLEEEVRSEAMVRDMGAFSRFLELAGLESGKIINLHALSQEVGVNYKTIAGYFDILVDCLIAERIEPITESRTRKKLTKSSRYLLFDMGVRRLCAREGTQLGDTRYGELFEQYVGLELSRHARLAPSDIRLRYWRDADGPEVDWVVDRNREYIPIEVKWTAAPCARDIKHLTTFLQEYPQAKQGYVICRTPRPLQLADRITALPWTELSSIMNS